VKIGTTSRGIGPSYEDKMDAAMRVADLLDTQLLRTAHRECVPREKHDCACAVHSEPLDADKMFREYADAAEQMRPFVRDTGAAG